jgi:hypothetical protein
MYNIILNSQKDDIMGAYEWVEEHLNSDKYKVNHPMFPSPLWNFMFEDESDAIWFRLKWQH